MHEIDQYQLTCEQVNCKQTSSSFSAIHMLAPNKMRSTSFSGSENLQLHKWLEMSFYSYTREHLVICNFGLLDNKTHKFHQRMF